MKPSTKERICVPYRQSATALTLILAMLFPVSAPAATCADILHLIEQSRNQFLDIRVPVNAGPSSFGSSIDLPEATDCAIREDAEMASFHCTWTYPLGDSRAKEQYQRLIRETRSCLADIAEERIDRPVNHPDFFASHFYRFEDGEVSVALKNKSHLKATLVSLGIDGFKARE